MYVMFILMPQVWHSWMMRHYAKWNKPDTEDMTSWSLLCLESKDIKLTEVERRVVVTRIWWGGGGVSKKVEWGDIGQRIQVSFRQEKYVLGGCAVLLFFSDRVSLCIPGWPPTHGASASISQVLGLQMCTIMSGWEIDLLHSKVTIVNNILYISKIVMVVNFKCSHHKNDKYVRWWIH
jgi:hypothetical protein